MAADLLVPPAFLPPTAVLRISQKAPHSLKANPTTSLPFPLSFLTSSETADTWTDYDHSFISCLRTGDDRAAYTFLDRLTKRFGDDNERVTALWGLYREATAKDEKDLDGVVKWYEELIAEQPTNMPIRKRHIALVMSMNRSADAVAALTALVDVSPTDAEAWAELADLYFSLKMLPQACYCLEEVLLIAPFAWNIHARLGEVLFVYANSSPSDNDGNTIRRMTESMRRYCRSIELCDNYLRGYYGLKLATSRLLDILSMTSKTPTAVTDPTVGDLAPPSLSSIQQLHELATEKLAEIVRRGSAGEPGWDGYDQSELSAARGLLDRDLPKRDR